MYHESELALLQALIQSVKNPQEWFGAYGLNYYLFTSQMLYSS